MLGDTAVAATAARLGLLGNYATFQVGADLAEGWVALDRVERDGYLDSWLAVLIARHQHKGLAGSLLGGALAHAVIKPTVTCLVVEGRCPDPAAGNVAAWRDGAGTEVRCAVLGPGPRSGEG